MRAWMFPLLFAGVSAVFGATKPDATLIGQVACSSCWFEADRTRVPYGGPADDACAARCAKDGFPPALAVAGPDGAFTLYLLEARGLNLGERGWLAWIGKRVELQGQLKNTGERPTLLVDALAVPAVPADPAAVEDEAVVFGLRLPDLSGVEQDLRGLRGRVVVVNFWATWCAPCRKEIPLLSRVQRRFAARGVQLVGAAADAPSEATRVLAFAERADAQFPVWLGATAEDVERSGLPPILPGTVVLDRAGRIVERLAGTVHEAPLVAAIERALASDGADERR